MINVPAAADSPASTVNRSAGQRPFVDWVQIAANLKWARQWAFDIGHRLPELKRCHAAVRSVARSLAGVAIRIGRVITNPQREFNLTIVTVLNDLSNGLRVVERGQKTVVSHLEMDVERRLRELEQTVERLQARLSQSEARGRAA